MKFFFIYDTLMKLHIEIEENQCLILQKYKDVKVDGSQLICTVYKEKN